MVPTKKRQSIFVESDEEESSQSPQSPQPAQSAPEGESTHKRPVTEEEEPFVEHTAPSLGEPAYVQRERIRCGRVMVGRLAEYVRKTRPIVDIANWYDTQAGILAQSKAKLPPQIEKLEAEIAQKKAALASVEEREKELKEEMGAQAKEGHLAKHNIKHVKAWLNMQTDRLPKGFQD